MLISTLSFITTMYSQSEIINNGIITMWEGGDEDIYYNCNDFNEHNFGTLTSTNSLYLKSGQIIVSKETSVGDIIDCDMYYRIYKDGETPGEFVNVNLLWHSEWVETVGWTNQMWWNDSPDETNLDLLSGISSGTYNFEVYFSAENAGSTILYLNNATFNYIAQFTYSETTEVAKSIGSANSVSFEIFPNPSNEVINLQFNSATNIESIKMFNNQSSLVYDSGRSRGVSGTPVEISIEDMEAGTYFIRVQTEKGISVQRVVIAK